MILRNRLIEAELVKQLALASVTSPHHHPPPSRIAAGKRNHARHPSSTDFCNTICHERTSRDHLVGKSEERRWHGEVERHGNFEFDETFEFDWLQNREIVYKKPQDFKSCQRSSPSRKDRKSTR